MRNGHALAYTTKQVANICRVSSQMVNRWVDGNLMKGWRIPGSTHRRVTHEEVVRFMQAQGMPIDDLLGDHMAHILLFGCDSQLCETLQRCLPETSFSLHRTDTVFAAACIIGQKAPDSLVIDCDVGTGTVQEMLEGVLHDTTLGKMHTILLAGKKGMRHSAIHETFRKPLDASQFATHLHELIAKKKGWA